MSSKPSKAATRASARTKLAASASLPSVLPQRTTRAATAAKLKEPAAERNPPLKGSRRKPFVSKDNSPERASPVERSAQAKVLLSKLNSFVDAPPDLDREPVKAFLRIRPHLNEAEPTTSPYLEPLSETSVRMVDPSTSSSHSRLSTAGPSIYTFSHVFPQATNQQDFFRTTTLPLVKDVLQGESGLLFTYGVTNSGKTYTIQGGSGEGGAGILPRTLDVIFNSIEGLQGDGRYRPVRLQGIELADEMSTPSRPQRGGNLSIPVLADVFADESPLSPGTDSTTLKLDRNYEYTIWLSYAEVYNEKVYDLFASVDAPFMASSPSQSSSTPRPTSTILNLPLPSSQNRPLLVDRKPLPVKQCPPSDCDSSDSNAAGKYVAGLRQLRVRSAFQAKEFLRLGQIHRQVYGTLANSQSSRSHALVTVKVLRVHRGEKNDPTSIQTSRLTLVDLAGSERTKHTHTTGERLREAGNINKSLMVLGQCMETMRANQRTLARSLASAVGSGTRLDTRDVKKGLAMVPFRHSKLTEILMDYFVGEGRAVMIVNVNPFDTGYDENSHVMKFAALAREICTTAPSAIPRPLPVAKGKSVKVGPKPTEVPHRRKVTISFGGPGRKVSQTHLEVLEEDEEPEETDNDGDDNPIDPFVDTLFDEIEILRIKLFEAEMRCAIIEAETREEVMHEMEERMQSMEKMYTRRIMKEVERNEVKMDAKIDMLHRAGAIARVPPSRHLTVESDESDDSEEKDEVDDNVFESGEAIETQETEWVSDVNRSPSPLASKGKKVPPRASTPPSTSDIEMWPSEASDMESDIESSPPRPAPVRAPVQSKPNARSSKSRPEHLSRPPSPIFEDVKAAQKAKRSTRSTSNALSQLEKEMNELSMQGRDSTVVIPNKVARKGAIAHAGPDAEFVPRPGEVEVVKKKKRQLGKR